MVARAIGDFSVLSKKPTIVPILNAIKATVKDIDDLDAGKRDF
jgi:hypothetical protein